MYKFKAQDFREVLERDEYLADLLLEYQRISRKHIDRSMKTQEALTLLIYRGLVVTCGEEIAKEMIRKLIKLEFKNQ